MLQIATTMHSVTILSGDPPLTEYLINSFKLSSIAEYFAALTLMNNPKFICCVNQQRLIFNQYLSLANQG